MLILTEAHISPSFFIAFHYFSLHQIPLLISKSITKKWVSVSLTNSKFSIYGFFCSSLWVLVHFRNSFSLLSNGSTLVSSDQPRISRIKDVSSSIQSKYCNVQIKNVVVDFSGDIDEVVQKIKETIEGLDIGVLINNFGVSYPYARFFHEVDDGLLKNLIKVNVEGTTKVTQAVLPGMLKKKKGAIVNIGSGAAIVIPSDPLYAVYATTKAYIDRF